MKWTESEKRVRNIPEPLSTQANHCALCDTKTTRNRTRKFDKFTICYPCHRKAFIDYDYEVRRRLKL